MQLAYISTAHEHYGRDVPCHNALHAMMAVYVFNSVLRKTLGEPLNVSSNNLFLLIKSGIYFGMLH